MSVCLYMSVYLSVCLSICLSVCLSVRPSLFLSLGCRVLGVEVTSRSGPTPQECTDPSCLDIRA